MTTSDGRPPKSYWLKVDKTQNLWLFKTGQVQPEFRFKVRLIGIDPFARVFPERVQLLVVSGSLSKSGPDSFDPVKKWIIDAAQASDLHDT